MKAVNEAIKKENPVLSNSEGLQKQIYEYAVAYAECDKISKEQNAKRQEIRDKVKEKGIPSDSFLHEYQYYKKKRYQQDNYDEGRTICHDALNKATNGELFKWNEKPAKPAKQPAKNAQKPDKSGVGKADVGQAQVAAYEKAHG